MPHQRTLYTPFAILSATLCAGFAMPALAQMPSDSPCIPGETIALDMPTADSAVVDGMGETMLALTGADGTTVELSAAQMAALPQYALASENEYLDGLNCYQGPLARDVLALVNATAADTAALTAINDYSVDAPVSHMVEYDVIFATSINGEVLSVRDKGPIWVVYPQSDHENLRDALYSTYMVWQLNRVEIR